MAGVRLTILLLAGGLVLAGCRTDGQQRAVVVDASPAKSKPVTKSKNRPASGDWRPEVHVVKKGDTLYSIAFNYGMDYRELAELNGIQNPDLILIGQEVRLFPQARTPAPGKPETVGEAVVTPPPVEPPKKPPEILNKTAPKAVRLPYSEQALAQVEAMPDWSKPKQVAPVTVAKAPSADSGSVAATKSADDAKPVVSPKPVAAAGGGAATVVAATLPKPEIKPATRTESKPEPKVEPAKIEVPAPVENDDESGDDESVGWVAPTHGKVIGGFSESANRKGIDIAGKAGQPVYASGAGKVVYSGAGLRGYGKLIIIKHNKTYISAYAHNDKVLVKERQQVARGDKIAEMGSSDADQVKLHFEIRKFGKPIDPAKLLPPIQP